MIRGVWIRFSLCLALATLVSMTGLFCNSISDATKTTVEYITDLSTTYFRKDTLFFFYPQEGFQVDFYGTKSVSYQKKEDGVEKKRSYNEDSLYARFTTERDTFLFSGDSVQGRAQFHVKDIQTNFNWDFFLKAFTDTTFPILMGKIIADHIDSKQLDSLVQCDSAYKLTPSNKDSVINTLNRIIGVTNFYQQYRSEINEFVWDSTFYERLSQLSKENIMDTFGVVNTGIDTYQQEIIRRFNYNIFSTYFDNNPDEPVFTPFPVLGRVYTLSVKEGPTTNQLSTIARRFMKVNDTAMHQLFFQVANGIVNTEKDSKFSGFYFSSGLVWNVTPLLFHLDLPFISQQELVPLVQPGHAQIVFDSVVGTYENAKKFYRFTVNTSLSGEALFNDGKQYTVSGAVVLTAGFYNRSFGNIMYSVENDRGHFRYMDIDIELYGKSASKHELRYSEKRKLVTDSLNSSSY